MSKNWKMVIVLVVLSIPLFLWRVNGKPQRIQSKPGAVDTKVDSKLNPARSEPRKSMRAAGDIKLETPAALSDSSSRRSVVKMTDEDLLNLQGQGLTVFSPAGEPNPDVYRIFGFSPSQQQNFPEIWRKILDSIKAIEAYNMSNMIETKGQSSFEIGPIHQTGKDFRKTMETRLANQVPEDFLRYLTTYSLDDIRFLFCNFGDAKKTIQIVPEPGGGYKMTEVIQDMDPVSNLWTDLASRTLVFKEIPARYKRLLAP